MARLDIVRLVGDEETEPAVTALRTNQPWSFFIPGWFGCTRDGPQEGRVPGSHDHHIPLL